MKKFLIPLSLLTFCSPKVIETAVKQNNPVTVDANASEYGRLRYYDPDTKLFYHLASDTGNFYVCITTSDEATQQQIVLAGMEVWIDTTKKATQRVGVRYPLPMREMELPARRPSPGGNPFPDPAQFKRQVLVSQKVAELKGFKKIPDGLTPLETAEGFKVGIGWDKNDILVYELKVPLKNWYKNSSLAGNTKVFCLTIKINAVQLPSGSSPSGYMGYEPPSGMSGGFPGGGPPPGGPPPGAGPGGALAAMSEPHSLTMNFKLTTDEK